VLLVNHLNKKVLRTINNFDNVPISLCTINHESLEIGFCKLVLQHHFIKLCAHKSLSFNLLRLHITNNYGQHFIINKIVHMTSHSCPTNNMLHMIKHDPSILQIPCKLHSCDEANSTPIIIFGHLENEHLLSINLSWEIVF